MVERATKSCQILTKARKGVSQRHGAREQIDSSAQRHRLSPAVSPVANHAGPRPCIPVSSCVTIAAIAEKPPASLPSGTGGKGGGRRVPGAPFGKLAE
jgi:hypothetical protein